VCLSVCVFPVETATSWWWQVGGGGGKLAECIQSARRAGRSSAQSNERSQWSLLHAVLGRIHVHSLDMAHWPATNTSLFLPPPPPTRGVLARKLRPKAISRPDHRLRRLAKLFNVHNLTLTAHQSSGWPAGETILGRQLSGRRCPQLPS